MQFRWKFHTEMVLGWTKLLKVERPLSSLKDLNRAKSTQQDNVGQGEHMVFEQDDKSQTKPSLFLKGVCNAGRVIKKGVQVYNV